MEEFNYCSLTSEKAAVIADEEEQMLADEDGEEMNILLPNDVEGGNGVDNADIEPEIQVTTSDLGIEEVGTVHLVGLI